MRILKDELPAILPWVALDQFGAVIARFRDHDDALAYADAKTDKKGGPALRINPREEGRI